MPIKMPDLDTSSALSSCLESGRTTDQGQLGLTVLCDVRLATWLLWASVEGSL